MITLGDLPRRVVAFARDWLAGTGRIPSGRLFRSAARGGIILLIAALVVWLT
jgi:hypothetical protein